MRNDVHTAALRAAMKVAFSVAFVSGCSAPVTPGADGNDYEPTEPGTSESEISSGKKKPGRNKSGQLTTGCHKDAAPAPTASCEDVVDAAFPTEGDYPGVNQSVSAEVQACCGELLAKSGGMMEKHRWDCCANTDQTAPGVMIACTPWGPPVPPAMKRRAGRRVDPTTPPDAWIASEMREVA